jgi:hypothetical protein
LRIAGDDVTTFYSVLLAQKVWPDEIDAAATIGYLALALGIPLLGYVFMALDIRAYLRSLRRALVVARNYLPELPEWVRKDTPRCLLALGLTLPCSAEDVLSAYRKKVKTLHPDRGGDRRAFLRLQKHFELALRFVEEQRG